MTKQFDSLEDRFWSKVNKTKTCWIWIANKTRGGYGSFMLPRSVIRRTKRAHRMAYELTYGAIKSNLLVCHTCDNPPCVNPKHLYLADQKTNMEHASKRNRVQKGSKRYNAKLTENDVKQLRKDRSILSLKELADRYDLSISTVSLISRGLKWKHVK